MAAAAVRFQAFGFIVGDGPEMKNLQDSQSLTSPTV